MGLRLFQNWVVCALLVTGLVIASGITSCSSPGSTHRSPDRDQTLRFK